MSLLLDALKRAEQEKLAKQGERPANDAPRAHAPSPAAMPHREPANAPALELQPVASSASGANTASAKPSGAATAQAVFQAKGSCAPFFRASEITSLRMSSILCTPSKA